MSFNFTYFCNRLNYMLDFVKSIFMNFILLCATKNGLQSYWTLQKVWKMLQLYVQCWYLHRKRIQNNANHFPYLQKILHKRSRWRRKPCFACKLVTPEGLCSDYKHRPRMCRKYPVKRVTYPAKLHDGCGYKVNIKTFDDYLK